MVWLSVYAVPAGCFVVVDASRSAAVSESCSVATGGADVMVVFFAGRHSAQQRTVLAGSTT